MPKFAAFLLLCLAPAHLAYADGTRTWFQSRYDEFEKGTAKGVAIRSDGILELAPSVNPLTTSPSTYIWALASDSRGNVYAAAGAPARVYRITPKGETTVIFEPRELEVQALAIGGDGAIFAATSPDGKVYKIVHGPPQPLTTKKETAPQDPQAPPEKSEERSSAEKPVTVAIDPSYTASVWFDPKTKYIWSLALDAQGRLYVATGDRGEIFRVETSGSSSLFFKSDEAHIRVLAIDSRGNVIAGSDGSGLVYRISPAGEGFVLYSASKKEITALAIDARGDIFAAGVGEKRPQGLTFPGPQPTAPAVPPPTSSGPAGLTVGPPTGPALGTTSPISPFSTAGGSEIYRIVPDGSPKRIWSSHDDLVYSLGFDKSGRLLAGTGNRGRIFVVESEDRFTDLGKASASQVTGIAKALDGGLYLATSNLGKVFLVSGKTDSDGTFESDVLDARIFSRWGRAQVRATGYYELFGRSGNVDNPDRNWSPWKKVDLAHEAPLDTPPARFLQWKVVLHPANPPTTLDSVLINYLPKNVAPEVDEVYVQTGARFQPAVKPLGVQESVTVGPSTPAPAARFDAAPVAVRDPHSIAVRWTAHDENDDDLLYSLYYRGDGETRWKLLKGDLSDKYYSFDAALLPDGGYSILVVASDAPSHSEGALTDARESARFEVDTTPPQIERLVGQMNGNSIHVTFRAVDSFSPIQRAEYSVDAGDWQLVEPVGQLSDYRIENYDFNAPVPEGDNTLADDPADAAAAPHAVEPVRNAKSTAAAASSEHVIVVRVYDRFDNQSSAKTVVRGK
ncbi:MAG TPA: hypothetical protein VK473_10680 [Terriglobales bacterium]|nr:hypothetical protein [Terriglobales bacterium]